MEGSREDREGSEGMAGCMCKSWASTGIGCERPVAKGSKSGGEEEVVDFFFFLRKLLITPSRLGDS